MNRSLITGLLGVTLLGAAPALAQPQPDRGPRHGGPARIFQQADADRDGRVTEAEALNSLSARFSEVDANGDGALTREELGAFLRAQRQARRPAQDQNAQRPAVPSRLDAMFRAADADRNGQVTMEELRPIATALFRAADVNRDGVVEAAELRGPRPHGRGPG